MQPPEGHVFDVDGETNRKVQAMIASASAEGDVATNWTTNFNNISSTVDRIFGGG